VHTGGAASQGFHVMTGARLANGMSVGITSHKPTSGPRRCESVSGHNFRLARHPGLAAVGFSQASSEY